MDPREAPVLSRLYDAILWFFPTVAKFRRDVRYGLGERLTNALLDAHSALLDAAYNRQRGHVTPPPLTTSLDW